MHGNSNAGRWSLFWGWVETLGPEIDFVGNCMAKQTAYILLLKTTLGKKSKKEWEDMANLNLKYSKRQLSSVRNI